jgi:hypothetical protein
MENPKKKPCPASAAFDAFTKAFQEFEDAKTERVKCWQFMKCGREVQNRCAAFTKSAGRRCWLVAGTLSGGAPQCEFAKELSSCKECDFYKKIKKGEV